jgi:hypothetical protein
MHQSRGREAMSTSMQRRSNLDPTLPAQLFGLDVPPHNLPQTPLNSPLSGVGWRSRRKPRLLHPRQPLLKLLEFFFQTHQASFRAATRP